MNDKFFDGYEYGELGYPEMFEHLLPLLQPDKKALDLGIGTGHICSPIAFAGLLITGVDQDQNSLDYCAEAFVEAGLVNQLETVHSDTLEFLHTNKEKYDLVTISDVLMFIRKTDGKEILMLSFEALSLGGYIWITTMSTSGRFFARMQGGPTIDDETFLSYSPCRGSSPACFYYPGEIEKYLESMGAKLIFQCETMNSAGGLFNIVLAQKYF